MFPFLFSLAYSLRNCFRTRVALHAEILALRHQLLVLQRLNRDRRFRLKLADRVLWVWISRLWSGWRSALLIVKPETIIAWHRRGFRLYWAWKSRKPQGRPCVLRDVRDLVRRISVANPGWGAPRIHGELLKLGVEVSQTTVAKVHDPKSSTALADLENIPEKPHGGSGFGGFLRGPDSHVPPALCLLDSFP
jgi:putative transposase